MRAGRALSVAAYGGGVTRYRFVTLPTGAKAGPWRESIRAALEDAVTADCAQIDDQAEAGIQLDSMVMIEEENASTAISEAELWACASEVIKQHGEEAPVHIAERIGALVLECDVAGVRTWRSIAAKVDELRSGQGRRH